MTNWTKEYFNPQPKEPPVRLTKKEYREQRKRAYDEQFGCCLMCRKWFPENMLSWHHDNSGDSGGMGIKGDDDKGFLCCLKCHPD